MMVEYTLPCTIEGVLWLWRNKLVSAVLVHTVLAGLGAVLHQTCVLSM